MTGLLFRTGSGPLNTSSLPSGSPKLTINPLGYKSFSQKPNCKRITRALSDPKTITRFRSVSVGSQTSKEMLPELDEESLSEFLGVGNGNGRNRGGFGSGGSNGNGNGKSNDNRDEIGAHYKKMLKSNPNDPLVLRNYGKFLHEVQRDVVKAEEYYERAILANPGDGELLSLYGKLIWDTQRDGERAQSYFDQAVIASPNDCMVMGSYAQFMWEAEEEEDEDENNVSISEIQLALG